eukprot:CAMPEP_0197323700 /NCGR_PEP_ID=MMETSP0891-20130614/70682_1 /TAXON_ID=44058 ORGANISM="Aureoumbra lagunensis, Strain CCMP1510" /NCGR_SAMPLE_ID=MMETSP0891 /ASSEMBLY_ACC=CAM_ASM_000534 /LENGTH=295 /DNA_ID=CAMNT_0042816403 /DNA_START=677 /DNA_END=1565 /DNA_ORIENTATION=+
MGEGAADIATSTVVGTFRYMSPERLHGSRYSYASDVWSAGVVLVDAACGKPLFSTGASPVEIVQRLKDEGDQLAANALKSFSSELITLASNCLRIDPLYRPSCADLLNDEWLASTARASNSEDEDSCIEAAALRLQPWLSQLVVSGPECSSLANNSQPTVDRGLAPRLGYTVKSYQSTWQQPQNSDTLLETMRSSIGDDDDECNTTRRDSLNENNFNNSVNHTYYDLTKTIAEEEPYLNELDAPMTIDVDFDNLSSIYGVFTEAPALFFNLSGAFLSPSWNSNQPNEVRMKSILY